MARTENRASGENEASPPPSDQKPPVAAVDSAGNAAPPATDAIMMDGQGQPEIVLNSELAALYDRSWDTDTDIDIDLDFQFDLPDIDIFDSLPPGHRFAPTDEELIRCYLKPKVLKQPLPTNKIVSVEIYKRHPAELADTFKEFGEKEWYFFTPRDRKYQNGERPNREALGGYWKATGADKKILSKGSLIGCRKTLVFYQGKPQKGVKTNWIMHEFRFSDAPAHKRTDPSDMRLDDWVLCRIYEKPHNKNTMKLQDAEEESDLSSDEQNAGGHQLPSQPQPQEPQGQHPAPPGHFFTIRKEYYDCSLPQDAMRCKSQLTQPPPQQLKQPPAQPGQNATSFKNHYYPPATIHPCPRSPTDQFQSCPNFNNGACGLVFRPPQDYLQNGLSDFNYNELLPMMGNPGNFYLQNTLNHVASLTDSQNETQAMVLNSGLVHYIEADVINMDNSAPWQTMIRHENSQPEAWEHVVPDNGNAELWQLEIDPEQEQDVMRTFSEFGNGEPGILTREPVQRASNLNSSSDELPNAEHNRNTDNNLSK